VRPLLEITRGTAQFCQDMQLTVWEDSTNQDLVCSQPYPSGVTALQTHFNPEVEHALAQTAEILQAEVEYLEQAHS